VTPWRPHLRGRRLTLVPKVCAQPGIASHRIALEWVCAAPVSSLLVVSGGCVWRCTTGVVYATRVLSAPGVAATNTDVTRSGAEHGQQEMADHQVC
jgi:hypothetical protein